MNSTKMFQDAMKLFLADDIEEVFDSETNGFMYQVGENKREVRIFTKPGRTLITCNCKNGTMFPNEPILCKHRVAVIWMLPRVRNLGRLLK